VKASRKVTISDIAAAAGVSKTTVSRFINGRSDLMSEKTWERIRAVIEMSNYRPSDAARSLKSQRTRMIGVLISDISSPFSSAVVLGVSDYLDRKGYTPIFVNCDDSAEKEAHYLSSLLAKDVDGLLVNPSSQENPQLITLACQGMPIVLCDRYVNNYQFDIVTGEYERSMENAVAHLKEQGYTRPAFFTQRWEHNSVRHQRRQGYLNAMQRLYGADAGSDVYLVSTHNPVSFENALDRFLSSLRPGDIPAIVGVNSVTTMHMLNLLKRRGLRMPDQMGLCGPEDWDWSPQMNWPQLVEPNVTTLMVHARELGATAARLLLRRIETPELPAQQVLLPCELIVRDSTRLSQKR